MCKTTLGNEFARNLSVDRSPFGPPVLQSPSLEDHKDSAELLEIDSLTSSVEALTSAIPFDINELSSRGLLAGMLIFVLLVAFLMWNYENFASLFGRRRARRFSSSHRRRSPRTGQFPGVAMSPPQSYAESEAERMAASQGQSGWQNGFSVPPNTPVLEESEAASDYRDEIGSEEYTEPVIESDEPDVEADEPKSLTSLRESNLIAALDASKKRLVAAESYSSELKTRVTESEKKVTLLEEQLLSAREGYVETDDHHPPVHDQSGPLQLKIDELESKLAAANIELEGTASGSHESELELREANEKLLRLEDAEKTAAEENAALKSELEKRIQENSQASEEAELTNQQLREKLDVETAAVTQAKEDLESTRRATAELQARVDDQDKALEEAGREKAEHLRLVADHDTAIAELKLNHDETIKTKQSEFDIASAELQTSISELQKALEDAHAEMKRLQDDAAETLGAFEAKETLSLKCLDELELRLAQSVESFEKEQSFRADVELSVQRLEQELNSQVTSSSKLQADLLTAEKALGAIEATGKERETKLQVDVDRLEQELSARDTEASQLEADLLEANEAAESAKTTKDQREAELQAEMERMEKDLSTQATEVSQLQADLAKANEAAESAKTSKDQREAELQAEMERM